MASDRMLRGRSPWGLGGAVYLLIRLLVRSRSFVNMRGRRCFLLGVGGVIECRSSMLDYTGALIGEQCSNSRYREGVLTVVVFEISLFYVKIFYYRPNTHNHHHQVLSHA